MTHGGKSPQALAKAEQRLTEIKAKQNIAQLVARGEVEVDGDPQQSLLRMVQTAATTERAFALTIEAELSGATCRDCRQQRTDLRACEHCGSMTAVLPASILTRTGSKVMGWKDEPHAYIKLWNDERDRLAKFSDLAIKANLTQMQVDLAKAQGQRIVDTVHRALNDPDWGLTAEQVDAGLRVIARHFTTS